MSKLKDRSKQWAMLIISPRILIKLYPMIGKTLIRIKIKKILQKSWVEIVMSCRKFGKYIRKKWTTFILRTCK
jgi:hypothetical protein